MKDNGQEMSRANSGPQEARREVEIVDAQVHVWPCPIPPHWVAAHRGEFQRAFTPDAAVAAMDAVGVSAAVLDPLVADERGGFVTTSYGLWAAAAYPARFSSVTRYDHRAQDLTALVEQAGKTDGLLGIRVGFADDEHAARYDAGEYGALFSAAENAELPAMLYATGRLDLVDRIARRYQRLDLIVDHVGLSQDPAEEAPFERLDDILRLSSHANVAVKLTGVHALSREPYPHGDIWGPIRRLIAAFGADRLLWGSDFTRFWGCTTYGAMVQLFREATELTELEKELILGKNLRRILRWSAERPQPPRLPAAEKTLE